MQTCEDTKDHEDTKDTKDREDVKDTQTSNHATTHMQTAVTPKIPKIAKTQHANWQTKLPSPPPHAREGVRNHTRRSSSTRSPTTYASQNHLRCTRRLTHTHARASEMHAERIPTRSDSIRMQSRNAHNHASNNLLVRNAPMISPMNLTTERIPTRSDSIRMQSRNAHDAHGISSYTRPRASPLHAEANPTPNQNGRCNEAPLPTQ